MKTERKQRLTWLLNFPLDIISFFFLVIFSDWLHSGGREEKFMFSAWTEPICCRVFELWIQYYHMWKLIKCWFKSKLRGGRTNMHSVLTHTHTHKEHTQKLISKKKTKKNSTFSTILDVTRHLSWIPGYEWSISSHRRARLLLLLHPAARWELHVLLPACRRKAQRWSTTWKLSGHVGSIVFVSAEHQRYKR